MENNTLPTWDLEALYPSLEAWEKDFKGLRPLAESFAQCRGTLSKSADNILKALKLSEDFSRLFGKVYSYASHKADEDTGNSENQARRDRVIGLLSELSQYQAWFTPELLQIPPDVMDRYLASETLAFHKRILTEELRSREHTLSEPEERLLGSFGEVFEASEKTFSLLNDADLTFGKITDENGNKTELTHGSYSRFNESRDRNVRRMAFKKMYKPYHQLRNTFASTLDATVKSHAVNARVRHFPSSLAASLHGDNIPVQVYTRLIETVNAKLPALHYYLNVRKKALNLKKLDIYDMFAPIIPNCKMEYTWEQTEDLVKKGLAPLGSQYASILDKAFSQRWIDVPERKGKRSGAYSGGCFDSYPYILLNFNGTLDSVFTLAHEAGHSMHSFFSNHNQEFTYSEYKIFVAEVASTTNEILLSEYLLANTDDKALRGYLLAHLANEIRCTIYRQAQFAEFELNIHNAVENGITLTADYLDSEYYKLNETFYQLKADKLISHEWARIPHFYYNFYVYKYATGMSAAIQLAQKILHGTDADREAYFNFLKAGSSKDVLDIMKDTGVDFTTPAPVAAALDYFQQIVSQLDHIVTQIK